MIASDELTSEDYEDDARHQLQEQIAEALAELSEATDAPTGFETRAEFSPEDVDFASDQWMSRLADVQGWMHFPFDLPTTSPAHFISQLIIALGFEEAGEGLDDKSGAVAVTEAALERLSERAELAVRQQQRFLTKLNSDGGSKTAATTEWEETWTDEEDSAEDIAAEPVAANADVWAISVLAGTELNLTPSYQRGDVWKPGDRQALIESILRGIPLPSIILLNTGASTPHEVVDGKQRLTAILRFIGKHPAAISKVEEVAEKYPEANFPSLFETDYQKFKKAWN